MELLTAIWLTISPPKLTCAETTFTKTCSVESMLNQYPQLDLDNDGNPLVITREMGKEIICGKGECPNLHVKYKQPTFCIESKDQSKKFYEQFFPYYKDQIKLGEHFNSIDYRDGCWSLIINGGTDTIQYKGNGKSAFVFKNRKDKSLISTMRTCGFFGVTKKTQSKHHQNSRILSIFPKFPIIIK